jgi:ribose transport system ATP-binding protein
MAGVQSADEGEYRLLSDLMVATNPAKMQKAGVSAVFQEFSLIPELTISENLFLGRELSHAGRLSKSQMREATRPMLARLGFALDPDAKVKTLRRAHQQMVEIAKALMRDAKVLIFDEPTASLADQEAAALFDLIEALKRSGIGIVYITHRMAEIDRLADRITVLRDGCNVCTLERHEADHSVLVKSMTGRSFESFYPAIRQQPGATVLGISGLRTRNRLVDGVDLEIRSGEVLGIAGLAGCGKSELVRSIFGLERIAEGSITFKGDELRRATPSKMLKRGICYFPSDRASEGLAMRQSVRANSTMAALDSPAFSFAKALIRRKREHGFAERVMERLNIKARSIETIADSLSGGNKQKVLLARGLSRDFDVYLFDEPTVGVDVQAKVEIYQFLKDLAESGKAVVVVSSDLPEVIHLAHRLCVMREGKIVASMAAQDISEEALLAAFFGHGDVERPVRTGERR